MEKLANGLNKECFWRHGAFTTIKRTEYMQKVNNGKNENYNKKIMIIVQKCGFCGREIVSKN